jgi:DNA-binding SARP family transcriptional activator
MWFAILGPLLVHDGEAEVDVPSGRQRVLLAVLVLHAGKPVAAGALAESMWDESPPPGVGVTLRSHVLRLRRALGPRAGARLLTRRPGYLLEAAEDEVDVLRFRRLGRDGNVAAQAGAWERAQALLGEALGLWRGAPLADIPSELLRRHQADDLRALRLQALEARIDADLHLGRHAGVIAELQRLTRSHPLRERLHALHMLALYRDGRQGDALAAYRQARRILIDELGMEPGAELRDLHQRILTADPALARPAPTPEAALPRPRELPAAVACFTGRAAELRALTGLLDQAGAGGPGTVVISAIGGTAGVGKTALALHWAHQVAGSFPDGQLYVNLRGYDPTGTPAAPEAAIRGFLDALGVPPGRIPPAPEAQAGLYRSLLAGKRMLIVADNARDERQVRPLLPASPASLVLVTSRNRLDGLAAADGARVLTLDVLTREEAADMLASRTGAARAAAEPAAVERIASLCACLPLALAIAAARAAARPRFPLAALAAELADAAGRLDTLDAGDPGSSVRAVFSWSTRQLTGEAARMFRLLGIHPGPDITVPAAASLAATAETDTRRQLGQLARAHLIAEHLPGRYAFHDLLRAYAAEQAHHTDGQADRAAAVGRILDHYLHTAACAARWLNPAMEPVSLAPPRPAAAPGHPADYSQALAWFKAEHQVLLAALSLACGYGFDSHAWQLPWAMTPFLHSHGQYQQWAATQRTALAAATRLGDADAQALSGRLLAQACAEFGDHDQARSHYASSLTLHQRLGNRLGEAKIHHNLAFLAERQGRYADALGHAERALRLYQAIGNNASRAGALNAVGWCHGLLGDYLQARVFCRQALTLSAETGDRWTGGYAWDSVGYAEHHLGNLTEAAACYQRALSLLREAGDRFQEAVTLTRLGDTCHAAGGPDRAREAWQQALAIFEELRHPDADKVRAKLASTDDHSIANPCP